MASVKFRGMEYEIPNEWTNREAMEIERIAQCSMRDIAEAFKEENLRWGQVVAFSYLAMRRAGATVELKDVLDATPDDLEIVGDKPAEPVQEGPSPNPLGANGGTSSDTTETPADAGNPS